MNDTNNKIMRILCIHGYRQSSDTFRNKLGALKKMLKKHVEFVFITAPHQVPPLPEQEKTNDPQFGWWFCSEDKKFSAKTECDSSVGLEESIALVEEVFKSQGPFDGMMGFSQGAAFTAILASHARKNPDSQIKFKFAILVAGFKSLSKSHEIYYEEPKFAFPTLQVMGETDQVIEKELSEKLLAHFENADTLIHAGGHYVPATSQQKSVYMKFLEKMSNL